MKLEKYKVRISDCGETERKQGTKFDKWWERNKHKGPKKAKKPMKDQILRLATFNIRNTADRYMERRDLLKSVLQNMDFDILAV